MVFAESFAQLAKPLSRPRFNADWRTIATSKDYAGWADKIAGESFGEDKGFAKNVRYKPLGVCAGIASWNSTFM